MNRFRSRLGALMRRHLKLRRALGYLLRNAEYTLRDFDYYLRQTHPQAQRITRAIVVGYLETTRSLAPLSRHDRLTTLRQFCRFVFLFDQKTYIPEARLPVREHRGCRTPICSIVTSGGQRRASTEPPSVTSVKSARCSKRSGRF